MQVIDFILIAIIAVLFLLALRYSLHHDSCSECGGSCSGCSSSCSMHRSKKGRKSSDVNEKARNAFMQRLKKE